MHIIGFLAGALTVGSSIPGVLRILRTRDVRAISLYQYAMLFAGVLLWFGYGVSIRAWPVVASNSVTACLSGVILYLKVRLSK